MGFGRMQDKTCGVRVMHLEKGMQGSFNVQAFGRFAI
jgi:hypothetical protein